LWTNPFNPNPYCSRGTTSAVLGLTPTIVVPTFRQLWPNPYYSRVEKTPKKNTTETQEKYSGPRSAVCKNT